MDGKKDVKFDLRGINLAFDEISWVEEKLDDWQVDVLERYVPSGTSDEEIDNERFADVQKRRSKLKTDSDDESPFIELNEGDDLVKKYPNLFTAFALLKFAFLNRKRQDFCPRKFGFNFWGDDDTAKDAAVIVADEPEQEEFKIRLSTTEDSEEEVKKPKKKRRKAKKKKRREEKLKKEAKNVETDDEEPIEANEQDCQCHRPDLVFFTDQNQAKIDKAFGSNHVKFVSEYRREKSLSFPEKLNPVDDTAEVSVAPSMKEILELKLKQNGRDYFLHRVMYLYSYVSKDEIEDSNIETPITLRGYVAEQNASYTTEYFVSGCVFFHCNVAIVMVEGGEYEIMRHFLEMRGTKLLGEMKNGRVLYVEAQTERRYFDKFFACTSRTCGSVDKIDRTKIDEMLMVFNSKMTGSYTKLAKLDESLFTPGSTIGIPDSMAENLPSLDEIKFILKYKALRKLPAFVDTFIEFPQVSDSSDEAWPAQEPHIPYNIFNPDPTEVKDLELEMLEKLDKLNVLEDLNINDKDSLSSLELDWSDNTEN